MRLFIALLLEEGTRERLVDVQRRLRQLDPSARYTLPEHLHLTLAFLGEVPPPREAAVRRAMEHTAFSPLTLTFAGTGRFRRDGGDIWWVSLAPNPPLNQLHRRLTGALEREGFQLERRPFRPHLTLARQVDPRLDPRAPLLADGPFCTQVPAMHLMLSQRVDGRLRYTPRFRRPAQL